MMKKIMFFALMSAMMVFASCDTNKEKTKDQGQQGTELVNGTDETSNDTTANEAQAGQETKTQAEETTPPEEQQKATTNDQPGNK